MHHHFEDLNPPRRLLFGVGPSNPEPRVLRVMAAPPLGALDPAFTALVDEVAELCRYVFRTRSWRSFPAPGAARAGLEAVLASVVEAGGPGGGGGNGQFGGRPAGGPRRPGPRGGPAAGGGPPRTSFLDLTQLQDQWSPERLPHHTPPAGLVYALREALRIVQTEGLERRWKRHRCVGAALAAGLEALGLRLFGDPR